jgi:hypothetical protein
MPSSGFIISHFLDEQLSDGTFEPSLQADLPFADARFALDVTRRDLSLEQRHSVGREARL